MINIRTYCCSCASSVRSKLQPPCVKTTIHIADGASHSIGANVSSTLVIPLRQFASLGLHKDCQLYEGVRYRASDS